MGDMEPPNFPCMVPEAVRLESPSMPIISLQTAINLDADSTTQTNQSINQNRFIASCVASESEARDDRN